MNRKMIIVVGILSFSTAFSATVQVPEEYATIQAAIDAASPGDKIIVSPGTYEENIDFSAKNIVLTSQDPNDREVVNATILKPGLKTTQGTGRARGGEITVPAGPVVEFSRGETSDAVLTGFTITGGVGKEVVIVICPLFLVQCL